MSITPGHVEGGYGFAQAAEAKGTIGRKVVYQLPRNPMDKTTLVSILPKQLREVKPTLFPGTFEMPAASPGDFSLLVLEGSSWWMPSMIERMPPTEVQVNSLELAKAVVRDYNNSIFQSEPGRRPGLFYILGEWDKKSIHGFVDPDTKQTFGQILVRAREEQKRWFLAIINEADKDWVRTSGNPLSIMEDAKIAAELSQLKDKPWMANIQAMKLNPCPSCGDMINLDYPVCKHCHAVVNPAKLKESGITFASNSK